MRKDIFEVHKPSALISAEYKTPIIQRGRIKGYEHYTLTPIQHDAMNYMCYIAREQIHKRVKVAETIEAFSSEDELFEFLEVQHFEINLKELSDFTDKYKHKQDKNELSAILDALCAVQVKVGIFKQDAALGEIHAVKTMSLLRNYTRVTNSTVADFQLEPEILLGWIHKTKPFAKLYLKIQTKLKLTYSKILYENCKDYERLKKPLTKSFEDWVRVLGIDKTKSNTGTPSQLKAAYLNKAIKEINEHTDIFIDDIKGKKTDGKTIMTVEFHTQKCDLIEDDDANLSIDEQIMKSKKLTIAHERLNKSKQYQTITNEKAWLKKTVESITDDFVHQLDMIEEAKLVLDTFDIKPFMDKLTNKYSDFIGMKDYKLIYLFDETKGDITKNALETYKILESLADEIIS
ncbi:MAG: hypothetical protein DRH57_03085 [Candidatus Cloacimonadota bacterium]|nr:MAG: hypothetical protein DRH57_03085 [Candidatus Cloacimonadota bacterium]